MQTEVMLENCLNLSLFLEKYKNYIFKVEENDTNIEIQFNNNIISKLAIGQASVID